MNYIPLSDLWINRLYFSISNEHKNSCLTVDCRYSGPARYRTNADNDFEQFCYYRQKKRDRLYNKFVPRRVNTEDVEITLRFTV